MCGWARRGGEYDFGFQAAQIWALIWDIWLNVLALLQSLAKSSCPPEA